VDIKLSKTAIKALEAMSKDEARRIRAALSRLPGGDVKKLKGQTAAYRLRVGGLRVLFDMSDDIRITAILPRGDAYKG
jgi:mRNA interferase RelE/StbE